MKKIEIAKRIVDDLIDYGCVDFSQDCYEEEKQYVVKLVLHRLQDYVIIEGTCLK